jgi:hypothetical protein
MTVEETFSHALASSHPSVVIVARPEDHKEYTHLGSISGLSVFVHVDNYWTIFERSDKRMIYVLCQLGTTQCLLARCEVFSDHPVSLLPR